MYWKTFLKGSQLARFYGLPKLHKHQEANESPLIRPIISSIDSNNYKLAKYLCFILSDHTTKDSLSLNSSASDNKLFISYDIGSLFTNIPFTETIDIAIDLIFSDNPEFPINKNLKQLFLVATSQMNFLYNGMFYDQIDRIATGSPLAPILANIFMGFHKGNWLHNYLGTKPLFYCRYVDDVFCIFKVPMT